MIYKLNQESRKVRDEVLENKKRKKEEEFEIFNSLKEFIPQHSLMVVFKIIEVDRGVSSKFLEIGEELKSFTDQEDSLELKDIEELKNEMHFFILKDVDDLGETLDAFLDKIKRLKERNRIDDSDSYSFLE